MVRIWRLPIHDLLKILIELLDAFLEVVFLGLFLGNHIVGRVGQKVRVGQLLRDFLQQAAQIIDTSSTVATSHLKLLDSRFRGNDSLGSRETTASLTLLAMSTIEPGGSRSSLGGFDFVTSFLAISAIKVRYELPSS